MEISTAARDGQRRRLSVTGQGSENVRFHSPDVSSNCFIARIPDDILSEIFLKIDNVQSLIRCRRVCKTWRRIIFSKTFARSFQARSPDPIAICRSGKLFYFFQDQELSIAAIASNHRKGSYSTRRSSPPVIHLVNSCNGLLCMTICSGISSLEGTYETCSLFKRRCHGETIFIVNPVTNEYIALPSCGQDMRMEMCGLGFCAQTNEFKVLRILGEKSDKDSPRELVQVYTIGSGKWRSVDVDLQCPFSFFPLYYQIHMLTSVNGSLYWINYPNPDNGVFVAFDIAKEQLQVFSEQKFDDLWELGHITGLGTFKGHLCLYCYHGLAYTNPPGSSGDALMIFLLNKDGSYKGRKSSSEFSVQIPMAFNLYKDRVKHCFENGTILFWKRDYLYSFVKETNKLKKYSECMIRSEEDVVVHVPSFVSLKDAVKGQSSLVQKLGSHRGQRNVLDVVVQMGKSLAELQDAAVITEAFLREKEEEIRVLRLQLSRYRTQWRDGVSNSE